MSKIVRRNSAVHELNNSTNTLPLLEAVRWRKATILSWTVVGVVATVAGLMLVQPRYTATTNLLLEVSSVGVASGGPSLLDSQVESQLQTLRSERLSRSVIDKLGLWNDKEFACTLGGLQRLAGSASACRSETADAPPQKEVVLAQFQNATSIKRVGQSFVAEVSFTSVDPEKAARTANALAAAYLEYRASTQTQGIDQTGARLERQITRLRQKSAAASAAADKLKDAEKPDQEPAEEQVRALTTQSQAYRSLSRTLLERYARSVHEHASPVSEAKVVSEATAPIKWSTPNVPLALLLGACGGCLIGLTAAVRKEYVARPIRSFEQIEKNVGVPALGIVPVVQGRRLLPESDQTPPLLLHDRGDALRGIRIAVAELCPPGACVIGVVSAHPGEGKSTIAFNLAILEAESGKRVLLIDANLRRPSIGKALTEGNLLPPLEGRAELSDAVTRNELGFDILGERAPESHQHPAVLLGSTAMRDLIASARGLYDCIVCDLPNVLGHADVQAAADAFDALVLVTEWGRTPSAAATRAALKSTVISERLVGVIINKAPLGSNVMS